nr:urease accessory protein UreF [Polymorphum gilvum]
MSETLSAAALYRLLAFLSPGFPVGAFTYSHGLEQVIDDGGVHDAATLQAWLADILCLGAGRTDAILLKEAHAAARRGDASTLVDLVDLGLALQPSKERHLESSAQGTAFVDAIGKAWRPGTDTPVGALFARLAGPAAPDAPRLWPYPVAVGLVAAACAIPLAAALTGFLHAFSANAVSAAVRAVPLGQSDGQRVLAGLEPVVADVAAQALAAGLDDLGSCVFLADIASMAHETQYTRLFRS